MAAVNTKPLTALVLAGFLKPSMEGVNIVSAPARAKERGITIAETKRDKAQNYQTVIRVTVKDKDGKTSIAGTIFDERPRVIDINGVPTEASLNQDMLYVLNLDKPGLIGAVGTILGDNKINISDFNLGRIPGKDRAVALVSVDSYIPEAIVDKIKQIQQVERVKVLRF